MNEVKRKNITLLLNEEIWYKFQVKCDKLGYIPSRIIEFFMRSFIKNPKIIIDEDYFDNFEEDFEEDDLTDEP